jgi:hypothetical protein
VFVGHGSGAAKKRDRERERGFSREWKNGVAVYEITSCKMEALKMKLLAKAKSDREKKSIEDTFEHFKTRTNKLKELEDLFSSDNAELRGKALFELCLFDGLEDLEIEANNIAAERRQGKK